MRIADLRPFWERGTGWWDERSAREQLLLGALGAVGLVALLLLLVVRPLRAERAQAIADLRNYALIDTRLRAAGPAAATAGARHGPPATIVAESAAAAGLTVQRIEPQGGRLNLVLANAPFDAVLRFVVDIEGRSTLRISEARIERAPLGAGQVSATFLLAGA